MEYPCNCSNAMWLTSNYKVFQNKEGRWMLTWIELDKEKAYTNVTPYGVTVNYCMFCGKKIKNMEDNQ